MESKHNSEFTTENEKDLAFAKWLCENTEFSLAEIASLCSSVHEFKLVMLMRRNVELDLPNINPVKDGIIKPEVLHSFRLSKKSVNDPIKKQVPKVYIPKTLRKYIGGVVSWFLQNHPNFGEKQIAKSLGVDRKKFLKLKEAMEDPVNPVSIQMFTEYNLEQILKGD